jgi:predicted CopG family antitoxin
LGIGDVYGLVGQPVLLDCPQPILPDDISSFKDFAANFKARDCGVLEKRLFLEIFEITGKCIFALKALDEKRGLKVRKNVIVSCNLHVTSYVGDKQIGKKVKLEKWTQFTEILEEEPVDDDFDVMLGNVSEALMSKAQSLKITFIDVNQDQDINADVHEKPNKAAQYQFLAENLSNIAKSDVQRRYSREMYNFASTARKMKVSFYDFIREYLPMPSKTSLNQLARKYEPKKHENEVENKDSSEPMPKKCRCGSENKRGRGNRGGRGRGRPRGSSRKVTVLHQEILDAVPQVSSF